ncbi:LOW QUALITY PROTEIN: annexin A9 [Megaptera novaeangliae]
MSVTSGKMGLSLAQEILSHLGLANTTAAWGTLRTFLSFSIDKDVQRLPRAIAGQGPRLLDETDNYQVLMRILISRSETDLLSIRVEFKKKFGKSLYSSLQNAVKGNCRSALLALCRAEDL